MVHWWRWFKIIIGKLNWDNWSGMLYTFVFFVNLLANCLCILSKYVVWMCGPDRLTIRRTQRWWRCLSAKRHSLIGKCKVPWCFYGSISTACWSRYKLSLLKCTTKALNQSVKISIRVDNRGFLSLQYMILTEDKQVCFVEYMVSRGGGGIVAKVLND